MTDNRRFFHRPWIVLVFIIGALLSCVLLNVVLTNVDRSRKIADAQDLLYQAQKEISGMTEDMLLEEQVVVSPDFQGHCVVGLTKQLYGTKRSFTEVVDEYSVTLSRRGWSYSAGGPGFRIFVSDSELFSIHIIDVTETYLCNATMNGYRVLYSINFHYTWPDRSSCVG